MGQSVLERILEQLDGLEPRELERVGDAVRERLAPPEEQHKRQAFRDALLAAGLVRQLRAPLPRNDRERRLVQAQGQPVSETIVKERR